MLAGVSMWNAPRVRPKKLRPCFRPSSLLLFTRLPRALIPGNPYPASCMDRPPEASGNPSAAILGAEPTTTSGMGGWIFTLVDGGASGHAFRT